MKKEYYEQIVGRIFDGVYVTDINRKIVFWNRGAKRISGFTFKEMKGKICSMNGLCHITENGESACKDNCPLKKAISENKEYETELFLRHKNGERIPVKIRTSPVLDEKGKMAGVIEVFSDNSKLIKAISAMEKIKKAASYDKLTGAKNRNFGEGRIREEVEKHKVKGDLGIIYLDIDHFKQINDIHGHGTGDRILYAVSKTILNSIRLNDVLIRWGGDEFIIILPGINFKTLKFIGKRIRYLVKATFILKDNVRMGVAVSSGATMIKKEDDMKTFIARADKLLYKSKSGGRDMISF